MTNCLEVKDLQLSIRNKPILQDITFAVPNGKIMALVGHNGAGKSTTMKAIMGWQDKDEGEISIQGIQQDKHFLRYKTQFSYIPEEPLLMSELTVYQHFQLYGASYQIEEDLLNERVEYYTKEFEIQDKLSEFPESLSKGMRQKVQTICALLPEVPLLLIDEPFMGLDIYAAQFLIEELKNRKEQGTAILLTTHQLEKVTDLCDYYVLLSNGVISESGEIEAFSGLQRREVHDE
ncbi:ABC transporter ATP-binding protein [Salinibacillus xinjiangensis]|uniref:ATP-binding cassette domain-containing protein n=1 Tax=Salinibacillus xinjiangensis TaxID=1229268 RepID=A0A6G1X8A3_9BACI|nr:ABC transporter ATP-binding protein [Salinibacillus xinjiangensis]MRG87233.1 ATP-binding cassette domain-containing protein [Salinibacillus xinjiangensis]